MTTIFGTSSDDTLIGAVTGDTYIGGLGNDIYVVTASGIQISEKPDEGIDTLQSSITTGLHPNVENLELTGSNPINGTGNALNNTITGNSANNVLNGGAGSDTLLGGLGNDTYVIDNTGDVIIELLNQGTDTVSSTVSFTLGSHLEKLVLAGSGNINGTGNNLNNTITGNKGNNQLFGGEGNDTLNGGSGGNDTLAGGIGDDVYILGNATHEIIENAGEGIDTVRSEFNFTLSANVENLVLLDTGSATEGIGNDLDNSITGNQANNILRGGNGNDTLSGGPAGADILDGGLGNDTYIVRGSDDTILPDAGGIDTVSSDTSFTLSDTLENLGLRGFSNINGTGNSANNLITGNGFDNILDGAGGDDTLGGAGGNDTYIVDSTGDVVQESSGGGTDTVQSFVSYALANGQEVENLELQGGTNPLFGTGNNIANRITGNDGNNSLSGLGGDDTLYGKLGNDVLVGGNGNDTLIGAGLNSLGNGEVDILIGGLDKDRFVLGENSNVYYSTNSFADYALIVDFTLGDDVIQLEGDASQYALTNLGGLTTITFVPSNDLIAYIQGDELTAGDISNSSVFSFV